MEKIIVLIPVYKNVIGLQKTLESLRIEFGEFPFDVLLIDDSPTPELDALDFSSFPFKTFVITNDRNLGITKSLNRGLAWIKERRVYSLIARLDAGDEAVNHRFARQAAYMLAHPDCVLLGGAVQYTTEQGEKLYTFSPPTGNDLLRKKMHVNNSIAHPAAMMRTGAVMAVDGYREAYSAAEDYDLFWRLARLGEIANLPEIIIKYEVSSHQISLSKRRRQIKSRLQIQIENFEWLCFDSYWGVLKSITAFVVPWRVIISTKTFFQRLLYADA